MLNVIIIDSTASQRHFWHEKVLRSLKEVEEASFHGHVMIPNLSLNTLAPEELGYHQSANLYIIGEELLTHDLRLLKTIKHRNSKAVILLSISKAKIIELSKLECFIKQGVDDFITTDISSIDLVIKLILQSERIESAQQGKVILIDSAKGGQGATTVCAGLGEVLSIGTKRVLLIDLDSDSQDLSRYLQARPYYNENLSEILRGSRLVTQESFLDCITSTNFNENLYVLTPTTHDDYQQRNNSQGLKNIGQLLSLAVREFDYLLIDGASQRFNDLSFWYRFCSDVLLIVNNDPASCLSAIIKLKQIQAVLGKEQKLHILENRMANCGLSSKLLQEQINLQVDLEGRWIARNIKWTSTGYSWPASGKTFYGLSGSHNQKCLEQCVELIHPELKQKKFLQEKFAYFRNGVLYSQRLVTVWKQKIAEQKRLLAEKKLIELPKITDTQWDNQVLDVQSSVQLKNLNS